METLQPGQVLRLVACDTGAIEDLPAWCRLTGHQLRRAEHPTYFIQRKEDPIMARKFCVSLTRAKDDADKATVAFVIANAALGSEQETMVFLSTEGVRLAVKGYADDVHEPGFAPLKELMDNFVAAGGTIYVCSPCFKRRGLDEAKLVDGAKIVGGAKLVEYLSGGVPCVSY